MIASLATLVFGIVILAIAGASRHAPAIFANVAIASVFFAGVLKSAMPLRYVLALALGYGILAILRKNVGPEAVDIRFARVLGGYSLAATSLWIIGSPVAGIEPSEGDALFRYLVLLPVSATLGYTLVRTGNGASLKRSYLFWSLTMGSFAMVEAALGEMLLPRPDIARSLVRDGAQRAILASEHPLVLAALLVAATPLAVTLIARPSLRVVAVVVLFGGIFATDSRGAVVVFIVSLALALWSRRGERLSSGKAGALVSFPLVIISIAAVVAWAFSVAPSDTVLSSSDGTEASSQYRVVLYQYLLLSLREMPLGWGLGGLPEHTYIVPSAFGIKDLALTVDSEPALLVFKWGWLGLAFFGALLLWLAGRRRFLEPFGIASLSIVLSGVFLALSSWTGLPVALAMLLGATTASTSRDFDIRAIPARHSTKRVSIGARAK